MRKSCNTLAKPAASKYYCRYDIGLLSSKFPWFSFNSMDAFVEKWDGTSQNASGIGRNTSCTKSDQQDPRKSIEMCGSWWSTSWNQWFWRDYTVYTIHFWYFLVLFRMVLAKTHIFDSTWNPQGFGRRVSKAKACCCLPFPKPFWRSP